MLLPPEELLLEVLLPPEELLLEDVPLEEVPLLDELPPEEVLPEELLVELLVPEELLEDVPLEELPLLDELTPAVVLSEEPALVPVERSNGAFVGDVETDPQAASVKSSEQMTQRTDVAAPAARASGWCLPKCVRVIRLPAQVAAGRRSYDPLCTPETRAAAVV